MKTLRHGQATLVPSAAPRPSLADRALSASGGVAADRDRAPCPPRSSGDEAGYARWLARRTEQLDPLMGFLGIVFALLAAFELADPGLSPGWERGIAIAVWVIWGIFIVDFLASLAAAPSWTRYLRTNWLSVLMLFVPALRILRLGALLRLGRALPAARVVTTSYRATGVARQLLRSRTSYLAAVAATLTLAAAELVWLAERGRDTFETFGDALLWAAIAVVGMHADPNPETVAGRLVMLAAFAVGLVLIAGLAGVVGSYLLEDRREREREES